MKQNNTVVTLALLGVLALAALAGGCSLRETRSTRPILCSAILARTRYAICA